MARCNELCTKDATGFPIAITKFCTLDTIALFDKHLERLEKRGIQEIPRKGLSETSTRREMSRIMPSHETTSYQRVSGSYRGEGCLQ
jgi:hypothetical protein